MNIPELERQLAELPLYSYFFLPSKELVFSQRVREVCRQECPMYGKTWACPPAVGSVEVCKTRCLQYPDFLLLCTATEVSDITDLAATLDTREDHEAVTRQAEALIRAQGVETYTLSTEACAVCSQCTYPNRPCRHPERMYPCVESHGILLTHTAEACGIPFQYGGNVVTWFSIIFFRDK